MEETILLGLPVACTDGEAGAVSGVVFNPNTNALEYLVVSPSAPGRDHYVPRGKIAGVGDTVALSLSIADLQGLPEVGTRDPEEAGTIGSNLDDLCIATANTPVVARGGGDLGRFHGVILSQDYHVERVMTRDVDSDVVGTYRIDRASRDTLTVVPL